MVPEPLSVKARVPVHDRFHAHRTSCGYRNHCHSGGDASAGINQGEAERATDRLPFEHEADRDRSNDVRS